MADLQSQDYHPALGLDAHAAAVRDHERKSPSSSMSPAASAARPARPRAWNGTTCATRSAISRASTTTRSTSTRHLDADALHRMGGREGQSRMADPQGRLHALRGSGLPQGLPRARRDRAIRQRHRRFHQRELHRLRLLRERLPVQHSAHLARSTTNPTNARCAPTGSRVGLEPACVKACPTGAIMFGSKTGHDGLGRRAHRRPQIARLRQCRAL